MLPYIFFPLCCKSYDPTRTLLKKIDLSRPLPRCVSLLVLFHIAVLTGSTMGQYTVNRRTLQESLVHSLLEWDSLASTKALFACGL